MTEQLLRRLQEKFTAGTLRPNELDNSGLSLIHQAAGDGQLTCLKWLLKHGGDPNIRSAEGLVPSHHAAGGGHLQILQYLYDRNKECVSMKDNNDVTPLYIAAQEGQLDCLIWLTMISSVSANDRTNTGMTASHVAAQEGHLECLRYLLNAAHAQTAIKDRCGCTLLHYAAAEGHWKITKWLIEHCGINGEEQDNVGATALHISAKCGHDQVLQTLMKGGVSPDVTDNQGKTALDYAMESRKTACVTFLKGINCSLSNDSKNMKKVRFNELVHTYDPGTFSSRKNTFPSKFGRKDRPDYFWDDDFQAQFDYWKNSPQTKRKREKKKKIGLYKGRSTNLTKIEDKNNNAEEIIEANVRLDSPDILKDLNDNSIIYASVKKNDPAKSPPQVPVRNGVPKIPKHDPPRVPLRHTNKETDATRSNVKATKNSPINSPKLTSTPVHPPNVPARQNGLNTRIIKQNLNLEDEVQFLYPSPNSDKKQFFAPVHSPLLSNNRTTLSTVAPMLYPQYKSRLKQDEHDGRPNRDATKYSPLSYIDNRARNLKTFKNVNNGYLLNQVNNWSNGNKPSFTNHLFGLDMPAISEKNKVNFFSNNLMSQKKATTWSTIRQGVSSFFNSMRHKRMEPNDPFTWSVTRKRLPPRDDIFSRFSIPHKSNRREFDDLFNNSLEGNYTSFNHNTMYITTPQTKGRKLTSLQSDYDESELTRFKTRTLDNSLRGTNHFVTESTKDSMESYLNKPTSLSRLKANTKSPKERVNAIIW